MQSTSLGEICVHEFVVHCAFGTNIDKGANSAVNAKPFLFFWGSVFKIGFFVSIVTSIMIIC